MIEKRFPVNLESEGNVIEAVATALEDPDDGELYIPIAVFHGGRSYDIAKVNDDGTAIYRIRDELSSLRGALRN